MRSSHTLTAVNKMEIIMLSRTHYKTALVIAAVIDVLILAGILYLIFS